MPVTDTSILPEFFAFTNDEYRLLTGTLREENRVSGLSLWEYNRQISLYDKISQQRMLLPFTSLPKHVARGEKEGEYIAWMGNEMILWDRYGRIAPYSF
ncbi:hypothetical protein H6768_00475 [Candidatus Peribacteria bacterium]|nr:hypothetical protein [Candidatus Peribacteria bacterium]